MGHVRGETERGAQVTPDDFISGAEGDYCLLDGTRVFVLVPQDDREQAAAELRAAWRELCDELAKAYPGRFVHWCVDALAKVLPK